MDSQESLDEKIREALSGQDLPDRDRPDGVKETVNSNIISFTGFVRKEKSCQRPVKGIKNEK